STLARRAIAASSFGSAAIGTTSAVTFIGEPVIRPKSSVWGIIQVNSSLANSDVELTRSGTLMLLLISLRSAIYFTPRGVNVKLVMGGRWPARDRKSVV